ncbi:Glycosyl hydrolases family 16 [bacterium A37T11]|nr:Glycosyl hydrolases family 16 [bacterium A37T11]
MKPLFFSVLFLFAFSHPASAQEPNYQLVWADEFNKDGRPDPANWTYEHGFERNHEDQWYQPENAWCENGNLIIEARREEKPNPSYDSTSSYWGKQRKEIHYTSSCLLTKGLHSWKYGRFEMRGRFDIDAGCWPAWWTLGEKGRWPANGEIDIMEYYRGKVLANIACRKADGAEWFSRKTPVDSLGGADWSKEFHVWRMDWDEQHIGLYLDGQLLIQVPLSNLVNKDGSGFEPFKQPHYMLLNFALGGDNGGDPSKTTFPKRFEVDYVRVYRQL